MPKTQLLGIGFGQNGSTSNRGAITLPFDLRGVRFLEQSLPDAERDQQRQQRPSDENIPLHGILLESW